MTHFTKMAPGGFIAMLLPEVKAANEAAGIALDMPNRVPVGFTIAQAAVESSWFGSFQSQHALNLFGIKADSSYHGATITEPTREVEDGKDVTITAAFRSYLTLQEGLEDHAKFLMENPRYAKCFETSDSKEFCRRVAAAGYATDPNYAHVICEIIDAHNLTQYDVAAAS